MVLRPSFPRTTVRDIVITNDTQFDSFLHARRYGRAQVGTWISRQKLDIRRFLYYFFDCDHLLGSGDSCLPYPIATLHQSPSRSDLHFMFIIVFIFCWNGIHNQNWCVDNGGGVSLVVWAERVVWVDLRVGSSNSIQGVVEVYITGYLSR